MATDQAMFVMLWAPLSDRLRSAAEDIAAISGWCPNPKAEIDHAVAVRSRGVN